MADERRPGVVWIFLRRFIGSIGLMFIPLPFGVFRRQLAGKWVEGGEMEFYSHPNFACTMHLIWVGWLVTIGTAVANHFGAVSDPDALDIFDRLGWIWLFVLTITVIVMGLQFDRVAVGFLMAAIAVSGLGLWLVQALSDLEILKWLWERITMIDVGVDSGVPMIVSFVLGIIFVCVAAWRRLNDRWILKPRGNYLEHENFQEKDRTIAKGAKTFVAVFPCLLRRYLLFGFGAIEVRSSTGTTVIDRIDGVFFARHHADIIKFRFGTTDVAAFDAEEEEAEEEAADDSL